MPPQLQVRAANAEKSLPARLFAVFKHQCIYGIRVWTPSPFTSAASWVSGLVYFDYELIIFLEAGAFPRLRHTRLDGSV